MSKQECNDCSILNNFARVLCGFLSDRRVSYGQLKRFFNQRIHWGDSNGRPCVRPSIECRNYTWKECGDCYHEDATSYQCRCGKKDARYDGHGAITFREFGRMSSSSGQGKRSDIDDLKEAIRSGADMLTLADNHPSWWRYTNAVKLYRGLLQSRVDAGERIIRDIRVLWGATGTGKTRWVREYMVSQGWSVYKPSYNNGNKMSFETYDGQVCFFLIFFSILVFIVLFVFRIAYFWTSSSWAI